MDGSLSVAGGEESEGQDATTRGEDGQSTHAQGQEQHGQECTEECEALGESQHPSAVLSA